MRTKLIEQRDAVAAEVETLLAGEPTAENLDAIDAKQSEIEAIDGRMATLDAFEKRQAELAASRKASGVSPVGGFKVTSEPMTYQRDSKSSFFKDLYFAERRNEPTAWERLNRHQTEMIVEKRAISTTDGAGGDFVPPAYLVDDFASLARAKRVTANLMTNDVLPEGADSIKIPAINVGSKAAFQTGNNQTTTTRDLVTSTVSGEIRTISGYEPVSLQLLEQSPLGAGMDRIVFADLIADYNLALSVGILANSDGTSNDIQGFVNLGVNTTNGIPTTWTETTPSATGMYVAVAQALSAVANNRYEDAEAIVMTPSTWYWATSLVDTAGRPLIVPNANGVMNGLGVNGAAGKPAGLVGNIQGVPVYIDATLTKVYATNQAPILVGKFSDSYLYEGTIKTRVLSETQGKDLTILFQAYGYVAALHRYAKSVSAITGTGTKSPTGF